MALHASSYLYHHPHAHRSGPGKVQRGYGAGMRANWSLRFSYWSGRQAGRQATGITYLLHGHGQSPQRFPRSVKFFSASFMSLLIWSIPSSMRSSCSELNISQLRPPRNKEYGKGNGEREKEKAERRKRGQKERERLETFTWQQTVRQQHAGEALGASPVPTCRRDIQVHSICLHLLNFSLPPSCLCWYGSCHLQHARVALVRTKGWQQWNDILHPGRQTVMTTCDLNCPETCIYVNVRHLWCDGLVRLG